MLRKANANQCWIKAKLTTVTITRYAIDNKFWDEEGGGWDQK